MWAFAAHFIVMKKIAHHEDWQYQAGDEQGNTKNQADRSALAEGEADYQTTNEENQTKRNSKRETVRTIKSAACFSGLRSVRVHFKKPPFVAGKTRGRHLGSIELTFTPAVGSCQHYRLSVWLRIIDPPYRTWWY